MVCYWFMLEKYVFVLPADIYFCFVAISAGIFLSTYTMSSVEEPLGCDKLPSMSTMDRIQRFSSTVCRSSSDDAALGNCWIEGRSCSTSNSYK